MMLRTPSTESADDQDVEVSSGIEVIRPDSAEDLHMYRGSVGIVHGLGLCLVGGGERETGPGRLVDALGTPLID